MQSTDTTDDVKLKATAREIATFSSGHSKDDPSPIGETLYVRKGVWFLSRRQGGAEQIVPMTAREAQAWLEQKCLYGALALHFGQRVKGQAASVL